MTTQHIPRVEGIVSAIDRLCEQIKNDVHESEAHDAHVSLDGQHSVELWHVPISTMHDGRHVVFCEAVMTVWQPKGSVRLMVSYREGALNNVEQHFFRYNDDKYHVRVDTEDISTIKNKAVRKAAQQLSSIIEAYLLPIEAWKVAQQEAA